MTRRAWRWVGGLAVVDLVAFVLTIHAHVEYHRAANGPTVTTLGQLLGWIISVGLLVIIGLIVLAARQAQRYQSGRTPPNRRPI